MQILISYSAGLYVACALVAGGATALLYYKNKKDEYPKRVRAILSLLRFVLVFFICFLLLSPLIKMNSRRIEKPTVVVALDHSASILANISKPKQIDSVQQILKTKIDQFCAQLSTKYNVHPLSFGGKNENGFSYHFTQKQTNYASLFEEVKTRFTNREVGAFVLISDGNYNQGQEAISAYKNIGFPLYTVALGDTNPQIDLGVEEIHFNNFVFVKQNTPIEIDIFASKCKGQTAWISLYKGSKLLDKTSVQINSESFAKSVSFNFVAEDLGLQKYTVICSTLKGEKNKFNNHKDFYLEVLEGKQKILLLAQSPHPDISALKQSIESHALYEVEVGLASKMNVSISNYNLVILHQLPSRENHISQLLKECTDKQIPRWYILGNLSDLNELNRWQSGVSIQSKGNRWNEVLARTSKDFNYFSLDANTQNAIQEFPPLYAPFGFYTLDPSAQNLFAQNIGNIESTYPLWLFNISSSQRSSVLCGSGLWRWRMQDFAKNKNTEAFDELIAKSIQFLAVQQKHEALQIKSPKLFYETEPVILNAELYNEAFECVNNVDVHLSLKDSNGKKYQFVFSPYQNSYRLEIGSLPIGLYTYTAWTHLGNKKHIAKGQFRLIDLALENTQWVANYTVLYNLAHRYQGKMYTLPQLDQLADQLLHTQSLPSIIYNEKSYIEFVHQKLVFFLLLLLLTLEWSIRKWYGCL
ncbi:MAG: hypothetical protein RR190_02015 [Bacteroidales bacterium]